MILSPFSSFLCGKCACCVDVIVVFLWSVHTCASQTLSCIREGACSVWMGRSYSTCTVYTWSASAGVHTYVCMCICKRQQLMNGSSLAHNSKPNLALGGEFLREGVKFGAATPFKLCECSSP